MTKPDLNAIQAWIDARKGLAVTHGQALRLMDLEHALARFLSLVADAQDTWDQDNQAQHDRIAAERAKAAGHAFTPTWRLAGRCEVCEGYSTDHVHPFTSRWAEGTRCDVCGSTRDAWCHQEENR